MKFPMKVLKIICISILFIVFIFNVVITAATYRGDIHGYYWELDSSTGILKIEHNGALPDYYSGASAPYSGSINGKYLGPMAKYVYYSEGITHISDYSLTARGLKPCSNVVEVYVSSTVTSVGECAFNADLQRLYVYSESVTFEQGAVPSSAIIYGYKGTNVESFAYKNGNEFVAMCREHTPVLNNYREATCDSEGYSGDYICDICNVTTTKGVIIEALGHDFQLVNNKLPDCVNQGYTGDIQCSRCLIVESYGEIIVENGHSWSEWSIVQNPTCTLKGAKLRFCSNCNEQEKGIVAEYGHILNKIDSKLPSCIEGGNVEYWDCLVCGKLYLDENTLLETTIEETLLNAKGHSYVNYISNNDATCCENGSKTSKCEECDEIDTIIDEGSALGHSFTDYVINNDATCIADGTKTAKCDRCDVTDTIVDEGSALGHTPGEWVVTKEATVDSEGEQVKYCTVCNAELEKETIAKLPAPITFTDVKSTAWYAEGVNYCATKGYITGVGNNKFNPDGKLTREQFVVILARIADADLTKYTSTDFTDVKVNSWYGPSVIWANESGYVNGIGNGKFGVGQNIDRESLATLFYRYAEKQGIDVSKKADMSEYSDYSKISSWSKDACAWAVNAGLLSSTDTKVLTLAPKMTVTRAQAAKIFMSYDNIQ